LNLIEKQKKFSALLCKLVLELNARGYEVTMGECWRPPETAKLYAMQGKGVVSSLHTLRLAADLCLFKNGKYLVRTEEYKEAGEIWESYSGEDYSCHWGGRFHDGNHFSIGHQNVK